ncbi:Mut7-C RNAse domain-containing protein [Hydrogenimonas sp. SS33]|uniref:Mut7-C RNAse domain-containing protein n=1 Tax=Hydrogenimonas leucolamina TaxID=2954236 RepID=UPI00336C2AF5
MDKRERKGDFCIPWKVRPRFVCDVHLAKVALSLRLLGFDTVWRNDIGDDEIVGICRFGRIGLTCDRALQARLPERIILFSCEASQRQVRRLALLMDLRRYAHPFHRSLCCNRAMVPCDKRMHRNEIPKETYRWLEGFWQCSKCGKIYWQGTHAMHMRQNILKWLGYQKTC